MIAKPESNLFKAEIERRKIAHLIHFTPTINLLSIYEFGRIMSRSKLEELDVDQTDIFDFVEFTDQMRFDDKSYINLSVQHPNSSLFARFREKTMQHNHITWCVISIDPKYIYKHDTLFSVTNAANSHNRKVTGITGDFDKFLMMFNSNLSIITSYNSKIISRTTDCLNLTTDEQAEVLVKDEIPICDILNVYFINESDLASTKAALSGYNTSRFLVDSSVFKPLKR